MPRICFPARATSRCFATATLTQNADLTTSSTGTVDLEANLITATLTSDVTTGSGAIRLLSATDIILGGVITTTGNVSLTATAGSISDLDVNAAVDIVATGLRLVAGLGIGTTTNHVETTVTTLTARATSGGIYLDETNALIVDDVTVPPSKRSGVDAGVTADDGRDAVGRADDRWQRLRLSS
jgi:hypothetical protein